MPRRLQVLLWMSVIAAAPMAGWAEGPGTGGALTAEERLQRLEQRISELESKHETELKKRDAEIGELKGQLSETRKAVVKQDEAWTNQMQAKQMQDITKDIIEDINTRKKDEPLTRLAAVANPDIAVVVDFLGLASSRNVDGSRNRLDVREAELDIRASVDPRADAVLVLAFARDAAPALFGAEDIQGPETKAEVEEAYLFLHDFGVPNVTARIGRYHVRFGRQNVLHLHDLPTSDTPFVNQSFLAPEALVDSGVELSWVIPNHWNEYFELISEFNAGEGGGSESPTLKGDARAQTPSIVNHLLWNKNLAKNLNLEIGASSLWGPSENNATDPRSGGRRDVWLYGTDLTLVRRDPTGGFFNQMVQAEAIYGHTRQEDGSMASSYGGYVLGQQQLDKDWYAGVRLDWTQDANNKDQSVYGVAPYLSWYWSEFLRFRVQYEYRGGSDVPGESLLFFQATWIYGAHPPHPYWAMK